MRCAFAAELGGQWGSGGAAIVGWLRELRPQTPVNVTPWFNIPSIARNTTLASDCLRLSASPAAWIRSLRTAVWEGTINVTAGSAPAPLPYEVSQTGRSLWLEFSLMSWGSCEAGLSRNTSTSFAAANWSVRILSSGPGGQGDEFTTIRLSPTSLSVDLSSSSLSPETGRGTYVAPVSTQGAAAGGFRGFTVLVDANVLEIFAHTDVQGEAVISAFAYPSLAASTGVYVSLEAGADTTACFNAAAYAMPEASLAGRGPNA